MAEWIAANRIHFDEYCEESRLERWGAIEQSATEGTFLWFVFSSTPDRALAAANFDRHKTLRRMAEEGLLDMDSGHRHTKQRHFKDAGRSCCVFVDNVALKACLERSFSGSPSQGGE